MTTSSAFPSDNGTATAASAAALSSGAGAAFTLYATGGRVYASNVREKLVDLGQMEEQQGPDGSTTYRFRLDGDETVASAGFPTAEDVLAHLAQSITFFFLDGQFTALADLGGVSRPDLPSATQIHIVLDRRGHASPAIEADV